MPTDQFSARYGDLCVKCNKEERQHNRTWC
jgi:hypothetical protein